MHFLSTLVKAVCLTIALGAPTAAFANVSTPSTIPSVEAPVAPSVCANGPSWKDAGEKFIADANKQGASLVKIAEEADGSFTVLFDVRGMATYAGEPDFILAMVFDPNGCFVMSIMITQQVLQDAFGVVLAAN